MLQFSTVFKPQKLGGKVLNSFRFLFSSLEAHKRSDTAKKYCRNQKGAVSWHLKYAAQANTATAHGYLLTNIYGRNEVDSSDVFSEGYFGDLSLQVKETIPFALPS